jgi:paired amphipathic helix protein Sin3a
MPPEEAARYHLDDCLGGTSSTLHQKVIRRIYGDKWSDVVEGLKRNPVVAVPLVLRRLRAKDEEWRAAQKRFNKIWREQNDKYYLKSLDHQSLLFKQTDAKNLRSKSLLGELETLYDERHEQNEANENRSPSSQSKVVAQEGPHLTLTYQDLSILEDANNLLIHHVKRQTSIPKDDKEKIKLMLKHFLMDMFKHPRQDLSDDEREDGEDDDDDSSKDEDGEDESESGERNSRNERSQKKKSRDDETNGVKNDSPVKIRSDENEDDERGKKNAVKEISEADIKIEPRDGRRTPLHARDMDPVSCRSF